jgi:hypothetical protein
VAQTFGLEQALAAFGPVTGAIFGKYAVGEPPPGSTRMNPSLLFRAITKVLSWRLRGRVWPHPFFRAKTSETLYPVTVLSKEQREALRAFCGPRPMAR